MKSSGDKDLSKADGARYEADVLDRQPRLSDLVPRATWVHGMLFFAALLVVGGLIAMHRSAVGEVSAASSIFNLGGTDSLASWFSSLALFLAASVALICYSLRRHNQSDYHNRYRVWLWGATLAVLLSLTASSPLHEVAGAHVAKLTGVGQSNAGFYWWFIPSLSVAVFTAIRMLFELSRSRIATTGMLGALSAYGVVLGSRLGINVGLDAGTAELVVGGCWLLGHALMFCSFLWYARHTVLDVQGLIAARPVSRTDEKQRKKASQPSSAVSNVDGSRKPQRRKDAAHDSPPAPKKKRSDVEPDMPATKRTTRLLEEAEIEQQRFEEEEELRQVKRPSRKRQTKPQQHDLQDDEPDIRKLSKSERKRLRKLKADQRRAA